jgi:hypothetical protein
MSEKEHNNFNSEIRVLEQGEGNYAIVKRQLASSLASSFIPESQFSSSMKAITALYYRSDSITLSYTS